MPYELILSSYGNNNKVNNRKPDTTILGQFKENMKQGLVYSISNIELGLFTPNNYYNGAFGKLFEGVSSSLSQTLNASLAGLGNDPIVGKFLPGAIRGLANPVLSLIGGMGNQVSGSLQNFARDSIVAPTRNAIVRWFDERPETSIADASSGSSTFMGDFSDMVSGAGSAISGMASNAYNGASSAISGAYNGTTSAISGAWDSAKMVADNPWGAIKAGSKSAWSWGKNKLIDLIWGEDSSAPYDQNLKVGDFSSYAQVYNEYTPKHKFLFKVAFFINKPYSDLIGNEFYYFVHSTDLPKVNFEYEQVNYYNYKTEVLKSTNFPSLKMKFWDDNTNSVVEFVRAYMQAYIPLTRGSDVKALMPDFYPLYAMDFNDDPSIWYSSDATNLSNNNLNFISHIAISHVYRYDQFRENLYILVNPRIKSIDMGDVTHKDTEVSEINIEFSYDTFFCNDRPVNDTPMYNLGKEDMFYKDYDAQLGGSKNAKDKPSAEYDLNSITDILLNSTTNNANLQNQVVDTESMVKNAEDRDKIMNAAKNPKFDFDPNQPHAVAPWENIVGPDYGQPYMSSSGSIVVPHIYNGTALRILPTDSRFAALKPYATNGDTKAYEQSTPANSLSKGI